MDIMQEMSTLRVMLDRAVTEAKERGQVLAKCEHDYRVAKAKYILQQRTEGTPVTILADLAKGEEHVARLCMERDIAQTLYDSSKEAINSYKLQIRIVQEQIQREWNQA